jgi:hypothetical protein
LLETVIGDIDRSEGIGGGAIAEPAVNVAPPALEEAALKKCASVFGAC